MKVTFTYAFIYVYDYTEHTQTKWGIANVVCVCMGVCPSSEKRIMQRLFKC